MAIYLAERGKHQCDRDRSETYARGNFLAQTRRKARPQCSALNDPMQLRVDFRQFGEGSS